MAALSFDFYFQVLVLLEHLLSSLSLPPDLSSLVDVQKRWQLLTNCEKFARLKWQPLITIVLFPLPHG
jgi:hypothetical protein